jgi:hypothetical protein
MAFGEDMAAVGTKDLYAPWKYSGFTATSPLVLIASS